MHGTFFHMNLQLGIFIAMILSAFENRLRAGLVYKQIEPLSRIKTLNEQRVRRISPVGKEVKVCGGNDLPKSQV